MDRVSFQSFAAHRATTKSRDLGFEAALSERGV